MMLSSMIRVEVAVVSDPANLAIGQQKKIIGRGIQRRIQRNNDLGLCFSLGQTVP